MNKVKVAFLDRDGVLNLKINGGYVGFKKYFKWIPGAKKTIKYLKNNNYKVVVVTNQSGVARGYFKIKDVLSLHKFMNMQLRKINTKIDHFLFCPHHVNGVIKKFKKKCSSRKPNNGMYKIIAKKYYIDKKNSFMIGDQLSDLIFAKKSGIPGYLFLEKNTYQFIKKISLN